MDYMELTCTSQSRAEDVMSSCVHSKDSHTPAVASLPAPALPELDDFREHMGGGSYLIIRLAT